MSKIERRATALEWERRLFRNTFTYQGESREVPGWFVKLQWRGRRRTLRLESGDRELAAREAEALWGELRRHGWEGVDRMRGDVGSRAGSGLNGGPRLIGVGPRKYVSNLNPGRTREYFAELEHEGVTEFVALASEEENEARLRAFEVRRELMEEGWERVRTAWQREVTVAVFWQPNPMVCTYTTFLTFPATMGGAERGDRAKGWRLVVVEPDGSVRRALVSWLGNAVGVAEVVGVPTLESVAPGRWSLVMCHQDLVTLGMRAWVARAGPGGTAALMLHYGVFRDSDAIFASVSGVTQGYFLRRLPPGDLLEPLLQAFPEGPIRTGDWERQVRRYFQEVFEPEARRVGTASVAGLTARETDVLELLRRGCVDKEIARELGISVWTVHSHLKRIFAKYGVRTRTEAVVRHLQK